MILIFLATCKHYDGVIWPEIKDKNFCADTNVGLGTRLMNTVFGLFKNKKESTTVSSGEKILIDIKSLTESDHMDFRKKALHIYLNGLRDALFGTKSIDDPVNVIGTVYAIYLSLHNSFIHDRYEHHWRFNETANVSIYIYIVYYMNVNVYVYLNCRQCTSSSHLWQILLSKQWILTLNPAFWSMI